MNCKIEREPTEEHLTEIKGWLYQEYKKDSEGFFGNWDLIHNSFVNKKLLIYLKDNIAIGFATICKSDDICGIDIFCIKMKERGKGYGGMFFQDLEQVLIEKHLIAINLFCAPVESETFWIKQAFIKAPDTPYNRELTYWKSLVSIQETTIETTCQNKIELWDAEPQGINKTLPKWTWEITSDSLNILQYAHYDWNIRITINGKIKNEAKVKWITGKHDQWIKSPFLYIPKEFIKELI